MDDMSLQINLGAIRSFSGELKFEFVVHSSGDAYIQVFAHDPTDRRKSWTMLTLEEKQYQELKNIIEKTDQTIEKMQAAGQVNKKLVRRL